MYNFTFQGLGSLVDYYYYYYYYYYWLTIVPFFLTIIAGLQTSCDQGDFSFEWVLRYSR